MPPSKTQGQWDTRRQGNKESATFLEPREDRFAVSQVYTANMHVSGKLLSWRGLREVKLKATALPDPNQLHHLETLDCGVERKKKKS